MLPEIGNSVLYVNLLICFILFSSGLAKNYIGRGSLLSISKIMWLIVFICSLTSLFVLVYSYLISDFSLLSVANHSHSAMPSLYKIGAAWGNHEGSMLLWNSVIATFTFFTLMLVPGSYRIKLGISYIQAITLFFFTAYTIFVSNPFTRVFPSPLEGLGLNPILQDVGLAMHPPVLYMGYIGFSVASAGAIASLIYRASAQEWIEVIKPCAWLSWSLLGVGILLGSWWAYRELGWGGFWFWDPVENSSLLPWLLGTALLHSFGSAKREDAQHNWCLLLSILTFVTTILGTFIVRSGIVTSVHSFALDPTRGNIILGFLAIYCLSAFSLFAVRSYEHGSKKAPLFSKITLLKFNNLLFAVAAFTVAMGTLYPVFLELYFNKKLSVGAPYYNTLMSPMSLSGIVLCALVWGLNFKKMPDKGYAKKHCILLSISLVISLILTYYFSLKVFCFLSTWLSLWLVMATLAYLFTKREPNFSMAIGHIGFAIMVGSIVFLAEKKAESQHYLKVGESFKFLGPEVKLKDIKFSTIENYIRQYAKVDIEGSSKNTITLFPETRFFPVEQQQTVEASIYHHLFYDLYLNISQMDKQRVMVTIQYKPLISWIWFGGFLIVASGIIRVYGSFKRIANGPLTNDNRKVINRKSNRAR